MSDLGYAGKYLEHPQPSLIAKLYRSIVSGMPFSDRGIFGVDLSKWQDRNDTPQGINFAQMKAYGTDFVIIKTSQNVWADEDFIVNWREAKLAGLPRASYHFYDPRAEPKAQAEKWHSLIADDPPEGRLWLDLEFPPDWGGAYTHWTHWRTCLEEVKRLSGLRVGIYTANWWWAQQTIGDYAYFGQYPLWVAQYTSNPAYVTLPKGWSSALIWQDGTPSIGLEIGVESLDIDHNKLNGGMDVLIAEFGAASLPPPPQGETMITGTVLANVSLRATPIDGAVIGYLTPQQTIKATDHQFQWLHISEVDGVAKIGWASAGTQEQYIRWEDVPVVVDPPPTESPFVSATVTRADGTKVEFVPRT